MPLTSAASRTETSTPVLRLTDVRVRVGNTVALDGLSLAVEPGEVVAVVGAAGAALFDTVCGFVRPEAGEITWHGAALRPRPHRLTTLGLARTLQGVGLYGGLTVLENVLVGAPGVPPVASVPVGRRAGVGVALLSSLRFRLRGGELHEHASDVLGRLGLGEYGAAELAAVPAELHNRVVLARALLAGPELLVLEGPSAGLDAAEAAALAGMVRGSSEAVLIVTTDAEFAARAADRVVSLEPGGDRH